jgi:hypothetical protein
MQVPAPRFFVERPGRLLVRGNGIRFGMCVRIVRPDVVVPELGARIGSGRTEPRVLIRRVVDHEVGEHRDPAAVGLRDERVEVLKRPGTRVDGPMVRHVVAVVAHWGWIESSSHRQSTPSSSR